MMTPQPPPDADAPNGALNVPVPNSTYPFFEPYPHLTDDQYDLFDRMSEISEDAYCAGWIGDNEYNIWDALTLSQPVPKYRFFNPRLLRRCKKLSDEIGGWICWTLGAPQFVPMAQWLEMVEARRKPDPSPAP